MKNINLTKTLFLLIGLLMSYVNSVAQCTYKDDFERSGIANWERPNTTASADGWIWNCCRHLEDDMDILQINGSTAAYQGYIKSPVLDNGCSNIKFSYLTQTGVNLKLELVQEEVVVWEKSIAVAKDQQWHEVSEEVSVEGKYQFVMTNVSATSGRSTGQFVIRVKDICISDALSNAITPIVSIDGIPQPEGGFWDKANVSFSISEDRALYYSTDGSAPVVDDSMLYTGAFDITETSKIRAISVVDGNIEASLDTLITVTATAFRFIVPEETNVFVGEKSTNVNVAGNYLLKHYIPFAEKQPVYIATSEGATTYAYNINGMHNYRISKEGTLTHVGVFTPNASNNHLTFTSEQLSLHHPKEIDYDVNSLNGRNMADVFLNINARGHLEISSDTTFQLVNLRNWQAIDTDVNNYFIEPDFYYTVINESGEEDNSVLSIDEKGFMQPLGSGTAIVLVGYDAMMCGHTRNVGNNGAAFFGAIWPENTGVFVLSVDAPESGIKPNMFIGEYWNSGVVDKVDSVFIDAEQDILYYEASKGGFDYTFSPEGVSMVTLAQPVLTENTTKYHGFSTEGVTVHEDGSYTIRLLHGRNIVKLTSAEGNSIYQVLSAKPVTYTIANFTNPGETIRPGNEVVISFSTLFHPSNKLSGIYNMSAGIQYASFDTTFPLILGPGQYTFASRALDYKIMVPEDYEGDELILTNGVIKVSGFGSPYGAHRNITLQNGVSPNLNASVRTAFFGSLPDVRIRLTNKPSMPTDLQAVQDLTSIVLSWMPSMDQVEGYNIYVNGDFYGTTTETSYTINGLAEGAEYLLEVEAFNIEGYTSDKAFIRQSILITGLNLSDTSALKVYPNPFAGFIVIEANNPGHAIVYDLSGKALLNFNVLAGRNQINMDMLKQGSYLLRFGRDTVKIVK